MLKNIFKKEKKFTFLTPISGTCISLDKVKDDMFSQKMLGDGFAIIPSHHILYSPIDGTITAMYPSKHAIGIKTKDFELLIHVGIDTVELNGEGFSSFVKQGDNIHAGDKLLEIDFDFIKSKRLDTTCMFVITSGQSVSISNSCIQVKSQEKMTNVKINFN